MDDGPKETEERSWKGLYCDNRLRFRYQSRYQFCGVRSGTCDSTVNRGGNQRSRSASVISSPSAPEREEPGPVFYSLKRPMPLAQYQVDHPFQPIIILESAFVGSLQEDNLIPIGPPSLGFVTEVSSTPAVQNIRRRITPSTPVFPPTRLLPLKPTTINAEVPKTALVTGRNEGNT